MHKLSAQDWQVLSPYLDEALDLHHEERAGFIASLHVHSPEIAEKLNLLLEMHQHIEQVGFLDASASDKMPRSQMSGREIGAYRLIEQIGHGGMGAVWLAERNDGRFERKVAIKFILLALSGEAAQERFLREGRILGRLNHPNIAELIDAGVSTAGEPYLVIEYVEGQPIDIFCDQRSMNVEGRIRQFLEVLGAVSYAHANLIVHRDLKPSNVLVDLNATSKLLDFGIAKLLDEGSNAAVQTILTQQAGGMLTLTYAAPEQLLGEPITTTTDVYALGVLLFVLLTGQHPSGRADSTHELIKSIVEKEPPYPSALVNQDKAHIDSANDRAARRGSTPERLASLLRGDLDTIIAKALKKTPNQRYSSVAALAQDLRRYLESEPISARPDTLAYRTIKFLRRNRLVVTLSVLAIIATIGGFIGIWIQMMNAKEQRDIAIRQLALANRVTDINDLLLTDLAPQGKPLMVNDLVDREERIVEREHFDIPVNHIELLISIGLQYSGQEQNDKALHVLEEAYRSSQALDANPVRAKAACALAQGLINGGDLARAEALFKEGMSEFGDNAQNAIDKAACSVTGSEIAYRQGEVKAEMERARDAEHIMTTTPIHSSVQELDVLMDLAYAYDDIGQYRESFANFQRASVLMTELGYDETRRATKLFNDWALALFYVGRPADAEKAFRRAIDISKANQGEDEVLPGLLYNYSLVVRDLGRLDEAEDYEERAMTSAKKAQDQSQIAQIIMQKARIFRDRQNFEDAAKSLAECDSLLHRLLPSGHYAFSSLDSEKSLLARARGDFSSALIFADTAVALNEASIKNGNQGANFLPILLTRRSSVELDLGQHERAEADAERALKILKETLEPGMLSSNAGRAYLALGRALKAEGKSDQARQAFQQAAIQLSDAVGQGHPDTQMAMQSAQPESSHR